MKKIISLFIVLGICLAFLPQSWANLDEALVGYWPFNGNANDESGSGNHGTVHGATLIEDRFGNPNSAYSFDGTDDFISVPDQPIWTLGVKPFTIVLWAKLKKIKARSPFIGHDEGGGEWNKWIFWYDKWGHDKPSGPALRFHINSHSLPPTDTVFVTWAPTVSEWYHVAVTRSNTSYSLFINGKRVAFGIDDNVIPNPDWPLTIGRAEHYFFNGLIDDVRIYNRSLSEDEILALFLGYQSDFSAFVLKNALITFAELSDRDQYYIKGNFTLGENSNGINPLEEVVKLKVGTSNLEVPAGSFFETGKRKYKFTGKLGDVHVHMNIKAVKYDKFGFMAWLRGVDLTDTPNPVPIGLSIGDDRGLTDIWLPGILILK